MQVLSICKVDRSSPSCKHNFSLLARVARQVRELRQPGEVYAQLMDLLARLAAKGLIHCDFNEFNLLARPPLLPGALLCAFPSFMSLYL